MATSRRFIPLLAGLLLLGACLVEAAPPTMVHVYKAVKDYGRVGDLRRAHPTGDTIDESEDGVNGYLVRRVKVRDEAHLLSLMGPSGKPTALPAEARQDSSSFVRAPCAPGGDTGQEVWIPGLPRIG